MVKVHAPILWSERRAVRGQPLLVLFPVGTNRSNVVKFWVKLSMSLSMLVVLSVGRKK